MADFSEVTAALKAAIVALAYPNGTSVPSAFGVEVQVTEGWPLPTTLDIIASKPGVSVANAVTLISIYPVPSTTGDGGTAMDMSPAVVSQATAGLSVSIVDAAVSITGTALGVENVVILANQSGYAVTAQPGDEAQTIASALFAQLQPVFPSATLDLSTPGVGEIEITGARQLTSRVGTTGVLGRTTHRERQQVRIVAWSSNPSDRNTVLKPIDAFLKAEVRLPLPDGTSSIFSYQGSNPSDDPERIGLYRRDLIYTATCDSIELLDAVEVTAVGFQVSLPGGAVISSST